MSPYVIVILIFLALAIGTAFMLVRRGEPAAPPPAAEFISEDPADREVRIQEIEDRGTELLRRRVEMDSARGTLGGRTEIFEAFERLEDRFRAGSITEEEFEAEKLRLLNG